MQTAVELIPEFKTKCSKLMFGTDYGFTRRESEILVLDCYDVHVDDIAKIMHREKKTILRHLANAKKKTQFTTMMRVAIAIWPVIN